MAGDWIKMRVWLSKDPRVISMADYMAVQRGFMNWLTDPVQQSCKNTAEEHVTRNVIVALCVTALLVTWGTAREQGDRDGDDLVLDHADFSTIDAMTDLPCFGAAMGCVGWAKEEEPFRIRFPKFFKDNESPDERHRRQAAERQARFREKQSREHNAKSDVTHNVTVTDREEKRREEKEEKKGSLSLPSWVPEDAWKAWLEVRPKVKAPNTPNALKLALRDLERLRDQGNDPRAVLEAAVVKGWRGLFPVAKEPQPVRADL